LFPTENTEVSPLSDGSVACSTVYDYIRIIASAGGSVFRSTGCEAAIVDFLGSPAGPSPATKSYF